MKDRIRRIMNLEGLNQHEFSSKLGISPASLSSIFTGRTKPTNNHVQAIHRVFPEINIIWLLFGDGPMFSTDSQESDGSIVSRVEMLDEHDKDGEEASNVSSAGSMGELFDTQTGVESPRRVCGTRSNNSHIVSANAKSEKAKSIDNINRRIKEIRVFFNDGTYEAFVPAIK